MTRRPRTRRVVLELDDDTHDLLSELCGQPAGYSTVDQVVRYIIHGFADGVRRPGSWERGCVEQFFGNDFESRPQSKR